MFLFLCCEDYSYAWCFDYCEHGAPFHVLFKILDGSSVMVVNRREPSHRVNLFYSLLVFSSYSFFFFLAGEWSHPPQCIFFEVLQAICDVQPDTLQKNFFNESFHADDFIASGANFLIHRLNIFQLPRTFMSGLHLAMKEAMHLVASSAVPV